jgi:hypothetical protein
MSVNIFGFNVTSCPRQEDDGDVTFLQNALCHRELENKLNFSAIDVRTEPKIKNFENQKTKVQSNANSQLLVWLKDMKNIWKDFPVETYERRKPATPIKYFDVCENDKKFEQLKLTSNGNLSNSEVLIFNENDSTCFSKLGVAKINGTFIEGYLNGMATIFFHNGSFIRAPFLNGSISGLLRKFSCQYGSCDFDYQPWNVPNRLEEVRPFVSRENLGRYQMLQKLVFCFKKSIFKIKIIVEVKYYLFLKSGSVLFKLLISWLLTTFKFSWDLV